ncbi:MBL fold metallo-hydrolase [Pseudomonas sp. PDM30]|uniref:MBL fold metallo-hydrolase n=1 Tax=Pseudomonas sp. PDM30 TaxID=2854773 RepID=UPI001C47665B|nr:MBL fold metallo-hydrolase [Pseudomonas sp. PDM30]MBV7488028.1 MBL fold metallo-hydrolase [Pseudomonas sp. PDM30]
MEKLIALPIKGEAFLLIRDGKTVLVDGGYNSRDLSRALKIHAPDLKIIDIVICTHADRDHAGGLATLIGTSKLTVGEFWLPGAWADSIPELIENPRTTMQGLISELDRTPRDLLRSLPNDVDAVAHHFETVATAERKEANSQKPADDFMERDVKFSYKTLLERLGYWNERPASDHNYRNYRHHRRLLSRTERAFESGRTQLRYRKAKGKITPAVANYWLELIDAAKAIRAIAAQAITYGVPIRWFDYNAFATSRSAQGGNAQFLEPLNSVEQPPPPPRKLSYLAQLSPANEQCLAFLAPADTTRLGVMFCGDSPLGDGPSYANSFLTKKIQPQSLLFVATAPHHGSENNQPAYRHISAWGHPLLWVRSGGSVKQPGATYKAIDPVNRACTHCPQKGLELREAVVHLERSTLCFRVSSHECACR